MTHSKEKDIIRNALEKVGVELDIAAAQLIRLGHTPENAHKAVNYSMAGYTVGLVKEEKGWLKKMKMVMVFILLMLIPGCFQCYPADYADETEEPSTCELATSEPDYFCSFQEFDDLTCVDMADGRLACYVPVENLCLAFELEELECVGWYDGY